MNLAASAWEFRHRFRIFGALFWISFSVYRIDHRNLGQSIAEFLCGFAHREATGADLRPVFLVGVLLAILAAAIRSWATAYIRPEVMVDGDLHTHTLVAEGPYRFVRNPLYLGTNLLALGYSLLASRLGAVLLVAGVFLFNYRIILREERELTRWRRVRIMSASGVRCRAYGLPFGHRLWHLSANQIGVRAVRGDVFLGAGAGSTGLCDHVQHQGLLPRFWDCHSASTSCALGWSGGENAKLEDPCAPLRLCSLAPMCAAFFRSTCRA